MKISHQNKQEIYVSYLLDFFFTKVLSVLCWNNNNEYWAVFFNLNFVVVSANVTVLLYCFFFFFFLSLLHFDLLAMIYPKFVLRLVEHPKSAWARIVF